MSRALVLSSALTAAAVLVGCLPQPASLRLQDVVGGRRRSLPDSSTAGRRDRHWSPFAGVGANAWWVLLAAPVAVVAVAGGPVLGVLAGLGALVGRRQWRSRARRRAADAERRGIVEACTVLASELRAGRAPTAALHAAADAAAGPARSSLRAAAASADLGGDVGAALGAVAPGCAVPEVLRSLAACWSVCAGTGSGLAAAVDRLEEGLRADADARQALASELAGPRATAGLLAGLPGVGLLLAGALGADPLHVLLHTPLGVVCLVAGVGLDALGVLWTSRLVRRAGG